MSFNTLRGARVITGIVAAAALSLSASAGVVAPDLEFYLQVGDANPIEFYPIGVQTGPDTWHWEGNYNDPNGEWAMPQFTIDGDTDPLLNSFIAFQNNTNATQIYTITVLLPVSPIPGASLMDGSVGGSVTDADGNGTATAAAIAGSSIYQGLVDGAPAFGPASALLPFPYAASVPVGGSTAAIGPASFGQPIPIPGPGVASTIGIQLQFSLTAGDSIALTSFFRVVPVPTPGALALLGMAGLTARRRRR